EPRRNRRRDDLLGEMNPSRDLRRSVSQQDTEPILGLDDLSLQVGQLGGGPCPFRLESIKIELRNHSLLEAKLRQPNGFIPRLEGAFGDLHLVIQPAEIKIRLGYSAD